MILNETIDLAGFIKELRKKQNISVKELADAIPITPQGLSNWLNSRNNIDWKINALVQLSKILNFELKILDGDIYVKESDSVDSDDYKEISLEGKRNVQYEIYEYLGDYSIVTLYTTQDNIDYPNIEDISLLFYEDIYNNKKEYLEDHVSEQDMVSVYGLLNNKTNTLEEDIGFELQPIYIKESYLKFFAPVIEKTDDGFEVIYASKDNDYKIVRTWAKTNGTHEDFRILEYKIDNVENELYWFKGFGIMPYSGKTVRDIKGFSQKIPCIYEKLNLINEAHWRYFDTNAREITSGVTLKKISSFADEYGDIIDNYPLEKYFSEGDTITVKRLVQPKYIEDRLGFEYKYYELSLTCLYLLDWEIQEQ